MSYKLNPEEKYIFATDLDGTFLAEFVSSLHIDAYEAVEKIKKHGHHFVIATGRSWWWAKMLYEQLDSVDASIHFSGAMVHHPTDENFDEYRTSINKEVVQKLIDELDIWSFANQVQAVGRKYHALWSKGDDLNKLFFNCYEYIIQWPMDSLSKEEFTDKVQSIIGDEYVVRVWNLFGDNKNYSAIISPQNTDKSIGLAKVAKYYGVPQENVIYFGDNVNDLEALKWAGQGYAVANAKDEVKAIADEVLTLTDNQGAVPKKIIELLDEAYNEKN